MLGYVGLGLLFLAILYTGRQANVYIRVSRKMGKCVLPLSPSGLQWLLVKIAGIGFAVLLCAVTYNYISRDIPLNISYILILTIVIYSSGRFLSKVVELREEGLFGHLNDIGYKDIRHYSFEGEGRRIRVKFTLRDNREFVSLMAKSDREAVKETIERLKRS